MHDAQESCFTFDTIVSPEDKTMKLFKMKSKDQKEKEKENIRVYKDMVKSEKESLSHYKESPSDDFLILEHVNKIYDNYVQAVFDFNLSVKKNEFIVFVGPSGCGKSTTLRMIAGLEDITSGNLFIDGEYSNYIPPKDRDIAMVFQSYALYPHMTVYDNMAFSLKIKHVDKNEIDRRVKGAAEILQLTDYLERKPKALSGGQCQRVALGRAIVRNAKLFLMDEPLSNLDAKLRVQMRSEIVEIHEKIHATTIYVTHDQTEAMTMADRIVVMNKGYVQQIGTPLEIYNNPSNVFVATFIGSPSMNILKAHLKMDQLKLMDGVTITLSEEQKQKTKRYYQDSIAKIENAIQVLKDKNANENKEIDDKKISKLELELEYAKKYLENEEIDIIFGIRPEDIIPSTSLSDTQDLSEEYHATVSMAELLGCEYYLHLSTSSSTLVSKVPLRKELYKKDEVFSYRINLAKMHIFDSMSEDAVF